MSIDAPDPAARDQVAQDQLEADVAVVHPDLQDLYRTVRSVMGAEADLVTPAADRRAAAEAGPSITGSLVERFEMHEVRDLEIEVDGRTIPARLYRPTADAVLPGHVHLHGGGWFLGSIESSDNGVRMMAATTGMAIVSVGYRLAPEHPWPAGPDDCYDATAWVHAHAGELGLDPDDLTVGGDSAGGNLAAVVALMARDRQGPPLAAQWLFIGAYDLTLPDTPSLARFGKGFALDRDEVGLCLEWYLGDQDPTHPYASPQHADVAGLPPAVVVSAGCDPLCDQSAAYAARLRAAGVPVTEIVCDGHLHGSMLLTGLSPSAKQHMADAAAALAAARAR